MKKRIIIIFIIFILLIFPIKNTYKDGGTVTYTSLTYKIICWKIPINIEIINSNDKDINQFKIKSFISSEAVPSHTLLSDKRVDAIFSNSGSGGSFHNSVSDFSKFQISFSASLTR